MDQRDPGLPISPSLQYFAFISTFPSPPIVQLHAGKQTPFQPLLTA